MHQENVSLKTADWSLNYVINLVSHSCIFFMPSKFRILKFEVISLSGYYGVSVSCDLWLNIWVSYYFRLLHYVSCRAAMLSSERCKLRFIRKVATRNISDFLLETAAAAEWSADNPLGNRGQELGHSTQQQQGNTDTTSKIIVLLILQQLQQKCAR